MQIVNSTVIGLIGFILEGFLNFGSHLKRWWYTLELFLVHFYNRVLLIPGNADKTLAMVVHGQNGSEQWVGDSIHLKHPPQDTPRETVKCLLQSTKHTGWATSLYPPK